MYGFYTEGRGLLVMSTRAFILCPLFPLLLRPETAQLCAGGLNLISATNMSVILGGRKVHLNKCFPTAQDIRLQSTEIQF